MIDLASIFHKVQLRSGMHVADFGCGRTGHVVFPLARLVGEMGLVYAVDIMKDVLVEVDKRAKDHAFLHVHPIWSDLERIGSTAIPGKSLDVAFLMNVLVQTMNRHAVLEEIHRLMKPASRILLIDWFKKGLHFGPASDRFIDFEDIKRWAMLKGMVVQEEFFVGDYHKGLVLYKHE